MSFGPGFPGCGLVGDDCCYGMGGFGCMIELTFADDLLGRRLILPRRYLYVPLFWNPLTIILTKHRLPKKTKQN